MKSHSKVSPQLAQRLAMKRYTKGSASMPARRSAGGAGTTQTAHERVLKALRYDSQEELFFACTSFILLLIVATADVLVRTH